MSVTTILTKEHAIGNMQAQGIALHPSAAEALLALRADALPRASFPQDPARNRALRGLAEDYFRLGVGKKRRNEVLRREGFDPDGEDGEIYRAAFDALLRS